MTMQIVPGRRAFRSLIAAASLKRRVQPLTLLSAFALPQPDRCGLIEAAGSREPRAEGRTAFRSLIAAASLKRFHTYIRITPQLCAAFRSLIAAASLKPTRTPRRSTP